MKNVGFLVEETVKTYRKVYETKQPISTFLLLSQGEDDVNWAQEGGIQFTPLAVNFEVILGSGMLKT